jgi:hypothetical protein
VLLQEHNLELTRLLVTKGARTADGASCVEAAVTVGWIALLQACFGECTATQ